MSCKQRQISEIGQAGASTHKIFKIQSYFICDLSLTALWMNATKTQESFRSKRHDKRLLSNQNNESTFGLAKLSCKLSFRFLQVHVIIFINRRSEDSGEAHPKTVQVMKDHVKISRNGSIEELRARQEKAKAKRDKTILQKQENSILFTAYYRLMRSLYNSITQRSILYLFETVNISRVKFNKKLFSQSQIGFHFQQINQAGFQKFYEYSIKILDSRILELVDILQRQHAAHLVHDIKIEIISFCMMKEEQYTKDCINDQKMSIFPLNKLAAILEIPDLQRLRRIYKRRKSGLKYLLQNSQLSHLFDTYYLLRIKNNISNKLMLKVKDNIIEDYFNRMQQAKAQVKLQLNTTIIVKRYLYQEYSEYIKNLRVKVPKKMEPGQIIEFAEVFEKIIRKQYTKQTRTKVTKQICKKYGIKECYKRLHRYQRAKVKLSERFGSDLSDQKRKLMAYSLTKNSAYTYQQILTNTYYARHIYIERSFFEENLEAVLRKEVQYNQMIYLNKVMQGIEEGKNKGNQIIFVDYYDVAGDTGRMKEEEDTFLEEINLISAVSLSGQFQCRMYSTKMNAHLFLKEAASMLQETHEFSTLVFFDREFPSSWLQREEIFKLRTSNVLLNVPFIEAVPNPSYRACKQVWSLVEQSLAKMEKNEQNIEKQFRQAVSSYKDNTLCKLIRNQWQKSKKFSFQIDQEKESSRNISKASKQEQRFEELQKDIKPQIGLKRQLFTNEQSLYIEGDNNQSEKNSQSSSEEIDKIYYQQGSSAQGEDLISLEQGVRNAIAQELPPMENIDHMNQEQLREMLSRIVKVNHEQLSFQFIKNDKRHYVWYLDL